MVRRLGDTELIFGGELAWYLENYLSYPYGPNAERAGRVLEALRAWGTEAFDALFGSGEARDFYRDASGDGRKDLQLVIVSDTPSVLAWPWEALRDPQVGDLAHLCRIERRLDRIDDPPPLRETLPRDRVSILLVTSRPYEGDVAYRSVSRPLVTMIQQKGLPAEVNVLRPPTFSRLRQELQDNPGAYHIVHFDGHGGFGEQAAVARDRFRGPSGRLMFEDEDGQPDEISAEKLSQLLREHRIPIAVLNACQSAMIDAGAEDAFASVAASLMRAGVRSVVAMGYSLYVNAAREFLPAFYERLFAAGDVAEAVRAGRQALLAEPERIPGFELADWLVPVLYQQQPLKLDFAAAAERGHAPDAPQIEEEAKLGRENTYGLIGRDSAVLALERASHRPPAGMLVHGLGGVGKTTLARGYIEWLAQTRGLANPPIWRSFVDIRSADYLLNQLVEKVFGANAMAAPDEQKWPALVDALRKTPWLIVFDNFESASGAAGEYAASGEAMPQADLQRLRDFLEDLRGGKTRVLITSRDPENWLGTTACYRVPLGGLQGEERIELTRAILKDQGVRYDPTDKDTADLVESLEGHPLMMRAILPRLGQQSAASLIQALDAYRPDAESANPLEQRLYAMFRFVEEGLPEQLRPLLYPISLHVGHVDADYLASMAEAAEQPFNVNETGRVLALLQGAGLAQGIGNNVFVLHPGLSRYLRARADCLADAGSAERWQQAFLSVMAQLADHFTSKALHEQRAVFHLFGASFEEAASMADNDFETYAAFAQALAAHALNRHNLPLAQRWFEELAEHCERHDQEHAAASAYHHLGMVAQQRRDLDTAERWYLKSLEIEERFGNEHGAATSYGQLGNLALDRHDLEAAERWYLKSLEIEERLGDVAGAATAYHQLGRVTQERRDLDAAERWYLKSLEIKERRGDELGAASTYNQLGIVAQERRDPKAAERWYLKSLEIKERLGDEPGAAITYHQLGRVTQERRDFDAAERWYLKSLEIEERLGNEHGAATSYGQLGNLALDRRDFDAAERWYLRSLEVNERLGDELGAASTYHQLGIVAQERCDFDAAERWYLRSLEINERLGNEYTAAMTYGQLGVLAVERRDLDASERWYLKALEVFERLGDEYYADMAKRGIDLLRGE